MWKYRPDLNILNVVVLARPNYSLPTLFLEWRRPRYWAILCRDPNICFELLIAELLMPARRPNSSNWDQRPNSSNWTHLPNSFNWDQCPNSSNWNPLSQFCYFLAQALLTCSHMYMEARRKGTFFG